MIELSEVNNALAYADNSSDVGAFPEGTVPVCGADTSAAYETDVSAVVRTPDGKFWSMSASGCSCGSTADKFGPFDTAAEAGAALGTNFTHEYASELS